MSNKGIMVAILTVMLLTGLGFSSVHAATFSTPQGATESGGNPVNATVTFTLEAGKIELTIQNLESNQKTVAQSISDLFFTVSDANAPFYNYTSSANFVTVAGNGTATGAGNGATGWGLSQSSLINFHLDDLNGNAGPEHTILGAPDGAGIYSNANNSIKGNGAHNPFIDQSAWFEFYVPGVTAESAISNVVFSFGTVSGNNVSVPEPASLVLLGAGLLGIAWFKRKPVMG